MQTPHTLHRQTLRLSQLASLCRVMAAFASPFALSREGVAVQEEGRAANAVRNVIVNDAVVRNGVAITITGLLLTLVVITHG